MHGELVTQNVMHASLCHMTSVGTGGTGGVTPRQGGQVRGGGGRGREGRWGSGGQVRETRGGERWRTDGVGTCTGGVRTNLYPMSHSSSPAARPYQLHSVQPP